MSIERLLAGADAPVNTGTILCRVSLDLLEQLGTRDSGGRKLEASIGEPVEWIEAIGEGVYEPVISTIDDGTHLCRCRAPQNHRPKPE